MSAIGKNTRAHPPSGVGRFGLFCIEPKMTLAIGYKWELEHDALSSIMIKVVTFRNSAKIP